MVSQESSAPADRGNLREFHTEERHGIFRRDLPYLHLLHVLRVPVEFRSVVSDVAVLALRNNTDDRPCLLLSR